MHKLTIEDDEGKTVVVPLIRDEITIGRQEGNSIRLTERNVSRRHARFFRKNGALFIEDLGSYTGVRVNGTRIAAATDLKDNDQILIGDYKLSVRIERPTATRLYGGGLAETLPAGAPALPAAAKPAAVPATTAPLPAPVAASPASAPAPTSDTLEAAPTIPVRTLAEQGLARGEEPARAARLVVTSTALAGTEFPLDRPSLVIGRTPENDIVLNHKSISRHHAKIIRDGDKYIVVDLESANGVRVNGTEFERVELQSGDTLELGHVRMRFMSATDFVDFELSPGGVASKTKYVVLGALGVVAAAGLAFAFLGDGEGDGPNARTPATPAATATPPPAPKPAGPPIGELAGKIREAMTAENWDEAVAAAAAARAAAPDSSEIQSLGDKAASEQQAASKFLALTQAADAGNHDEVMNLYEAIPAESVYKPRAEPYKTNAQTRLVTTHLTSAERLARRGQCEDARPEADAILAIDPGNARAQAVVDRCADLARRETERAERQAQAKAEAAAAPRVAARPAAEAPAPAPEPEPPAEEPAVAERPRPAAPPRPRPAAAAAPAAAPVDADALVNEAQQAWLKGDYTGAITASRKALRVQPNLSRAYQIIAVCSCSLRDAGGATKAYEKLEPRMRPLVKSMCQKSGITLE